jgi:hypothetical protein
LLFADSFSDAKEKGKRGQLQHLNFGISKDPGIAYVTMMSPFLEAELQKIKATKIGRFPTRSMIPTFTLLHLEPNSKVSLIFFSYLVAFQITF